MLRKIAFTLICILIVFGIVFGGHKLLSDKQTEAMKNYRPPPTPVTVTTAKAEDWYPYMTSVGSLQAQSVVVVQTEVAGVISQVNFQPGMPVKKDALLIQINNDVDEAQLKSNKASAELAKIIWNQDQKLFKTGAISSTTLDQAKASYREAMAAVEQTQATLNKKAILSPIDGLADITLQRVGDYLNVGDTITTLSSNDHLYVDFSLPEQNYPQLFPGQTVTLTVQAYPDRTFSGKVLTVDTQVDTQTRNIALRAELDNTSGMLVPGMFAELRVIQRKAQHVVTLPRTAVTGSLYGTSVYLIKGVGNTDLTVNLVPVTTGQVRQDSVEIISGVKAGQRVVSAGQIKLSNGQKVVIQQGIDKSDKDDKVQATVTGHE
ncbi:efflux RND transporter periplasmic adaptor subunit [Parendozoicomonas haliclonae]|uniref:Multidrug resistance protein MdtA n=1 Tax=Parendozoicomonas haliclonae TaxID=1960125 RepID=A0A1X7AMC0_9GAMM|nr:efflux RND transporter periplasmic adaptor subunit [Parendozoicomonas haliclonae]SMA49108.1 Multidrug resistance protein MdtA precursor [Parendozoicomonas haliclonae]